MLFTDKENSRSFSIFKTIECFCHEYFYISGVEKDIYKAKPIRFGLPGKIIFPSPQKFEKVLSEKYIS